MSVATGFSHENALQRGGGVGEEGGGGQQEWIGQALNHKIIAVLCFQ